MTEKQLAEALRTSMTDVLEKMFFIRGVDTAGVPPSAAERLAEMTFEGDPPGRFTLRATGPAARSIAADFLGAEESELPDREVDDVVCELANMICGSVLSRVESGTIFHLASPRIVEPHIQPQLPNAARRPPRVATHAIEISGGVLVASIQTESPECQQIEEYAY